MKHFGLLGLLGYLKAIPNFIAVTELLFCNNSLRFNKGNTTILSPVNTHETDFRNIISNIIFPHPSHP
jgi:hypothetical protein